MMLRCSTATCHPDGSTTGQGAGKRCRAQKHSGRHGDRRPDACRSIPLLPATCVMRLDNCFFSVLCARSLLLSGVRCACARARVRACGGAPRVAEISAGGARVGLSGTVGVYWSVGLTVRCWPVGRLVGLHRCTFLSVPAQHSGALWPCG